MVEGVDRVGYGSPYLLVEGWLPREEGEEIHCGGRLAYGVVADTEDSKLLSQEVRKRSNFLWPSLRLREQNTHSSQLRYSRLSR